MSQRVGGAKKWRQQNRDRFHFKKSNRFAKLSRNKARGGQNRHHLTNKCRGGDCSPENLLNLKVWKHELWHRLFKNSDPEYIISVLQRLMRMKKYRMEGQIHSVQAPVIETPIQIQREVTEFKPEDQEKIKHQYKKTGKLFILPGEKIQKYG